MAFNQLILLEFFLFTYTILVLFFIYQWINIPTFSPVYNLLIPDKISVVVAVKNEEENILNLLKSLENQTLSKDFFEVIVVDDNSKDRTLSLVKNFLENSKMRIQTYQNNRNGKKNAITKGIEKSIYEIIVATDGDCVANPKWLETMAIYFQEKHPKFVFGPVAIESANHNLFQQMQQIEFASLVGSGAASWKANMPNMCNGANIAYSKSVFYEVKGFEDNENLTSGDDEFLMHKVYKIYPNEVFFLKSSAALVYTKPVNNWHELFEQRTRWASKWEHYSDWKVKLVAFYIFTINFFQIASFFFVPFPTFILVWLSRIIVEYLFLYGILRFLGKTLNLNAFLPLTLIYPFYVVFFALAGRIKNIIK